MKHGTDFHEGDVFTTVSGNEWRVEMENATPEQAGVPPEFIDDALNGSQILFDGKIYLDGFLFVAA